YRTGARPGRVHRSRPDPARRGRAHGDRLEFWAGRLSQRLFELVGGVFIDLGIGVEDAAEHLFRALGKALQVNAAPERFAQLIGVIGKIFVTHFGLFVDDHGARRRAVVGVLALAGRDVEPDDVRWEEHTSEL